MTVKTDQLIPGEYYWVKYMQDSEWEICQAAKKDSFSILHLDRIRIGQLLPTWVHAIFCDKSGNPIPIKRPE